MAKNTGAGSRVGGPRGVHHRPLTADDRRAIRRAFIYWFIVVLLCVAILAGLAVGWVL